MQKELKANPAFLDENLDDICASVQERIVSILLKKLDAAAAQTGIRQVAIAGGVSANSGLRQSLASLGLERNWDVFIPKFEFCTDNAAMIAMAGHYKYLAGDFASQEVGPLARWVI